MAHNHITQGYTEACPACRSIRPATQTKEWVKLMIALVRRWELHTER